MAKQPEIVCIASIQKGGEIKDCPDTCPVFPLIESSVRLAISKHPTLAPSTIKEMNDFYKKQPKILEGVRREQKAVYERLEAQKIICQREQKGEFND